MSVRFTERSIQLRFVASVPASFAGSQGPVRDEQVAARRMDKQEDALVIGTEAVPPVPRR